MLVGGERLSVLSALTWEEINGEYFDSAESITRHAQALLSYDQASAVYNTLVLGKRVDADLHPCYSTWTLRLTGLYVTDITADHTGVVANMVYEKGEWI